MRPGVFSGLVSTARCIWRRSCCANAYMPWEGGAPRSHSPVSRVWMDASFMSAHDSPSRAHASWMVETFGITSTAFTHRRDAR